MPEIRATDVPAPGSPAAPLAVISQPLALRERLYESALFRKTVERFGWICSSYGLLDNHYHSTLETPLPNLVTGMKWLLGTFSQGWNRARGRQGELLKYLGALEPQIDDLGYATCTVPLKIGGTLGKPDTSEVNSKLTALALEKSGFGDKAAEFLNKIRGGK